MTDYIPTELDIIGEAKTLAMRLEAVAADIKTPAMARLDRELAIAVGGSARALAIAIDSYARGLDYLRRQEIEGFVIGYFDPRGERWMIHHAWCWGNLMVTPRPMAAARWAGLREAETWITLICQPKGEDSKGKPWAPPIAQLAERRLMIWAPALEMGEPVREYEPVGVMTA